VFKNVTRRALPASVCCLTDRREHIHKASLNIGVMVLLQNCASRYLFRSCISGNTDTEWC